MLRRHFSRFLTICFLLSLLFEPISPASTQSADPSMARDFIRVTKIELATNDLIYDPVSGKIYASTPDSAGAIGSSIVPINPRTGAVGAPVFVGSEPNKLAISDNGQYIYVGLDGHGGMRRVNVASQTADLLFSLGSDSIGGNFRAEDIVVLKGNPNAVAVSRKLGSSPRHEGVAIFDNGVQRPITTPRYTGSNVIEPSNDASVLYGLNTESTEFGFRVMSINSSGVEEISTTSGLVNTFETDLQYDSGNGLLYASSGAVIDPLSSTLAGTYASSGSVYPDSSKNLVYFLTKKWESPVEFTIYNQSTFNRIKSFTIPEVVGRPSSFIKVGDGLFAFRTDNRQVYILKLVEPTHSIYLPRVRSSCSAGICGHVTLNGVPAAGELLELRYYDGTQWATKASEKTNREGNYAFKDVPGLAAGQRYYVLYRNIYSHPGRLWTWATRELTSYAAGTAAPIGDFDLADITLGSPADQSIIALPYTFTWTARPATPSDDYEFNLYDPYDSRTTYFYTDPPLGYVASYRLAGLPPGFAPGVPYVWDVWLYSPDGGFGISYETRWVAFANAGRGTVTTAGAAAPGKIPGDWEYLVRP